MMKIAGFGFWDLELGGIEDWGRAMTMFSV